MTKHEALLALEEGKTLRHAYFSDTEWVTKDGNQYLFEDGVYCSVREFWKYRDGDSWETGWEIVDV